MILWWLLIGFLVVAVLHRLDLAVDSTARFGALSDKRDGRESPEVESSSEMSADWNAEWNAEWDAEGDSAGEPAISSYPDPVR
jgi:hypothetical protein